MNLLKRLNIIQSSINTYKKCSPGWDGAYGRSSGQLVIEKMMGVLLLNKNGYISQE